MKDPACHRPACTLPSRTAHQGAVLSTLHISPLDHLTHNRPASPLMRASSPRRQRWRGCVKFWGHRKRFNPHWSLYNACGWHPSVAANIEATNATVLD
jgi:hypothetical protein